MEKDCGCGGHVRSGSLGEVNFLICIECRYLKWEPFQGLTFVSPVYEFEFDISNLKGKISLENFLALIDRGLLQFGNDYAIDRDWFVDYYGFDDLEDLDIELEEFCVDYLSSDTEFVVRVVQQMTRWDLPGAAEEVEGLDNDIVEAKDLGQYSTQELLSGAIENLWREMGEYVQKDRAYRLRDTLAELDIDGTSVVVKNVSWDLESTIGSLLNNPEIQR